ncbi:MULTISPECIES: class II glutamine amidotransferase [unclassified Moraxella]|uniref:class II glutamine amidotransferase n=1 Tax=unclassified Moraxella TaxID=2685852 RepID=UPI003AF999D0
MCQLLGMNCNTPTDINFSFAGFRKRGGQTDHHKDGFGIVFFERSQSGANAGLRQFHDDKPSYCSPVADLINAYPIKAMNVICHIRKATQGVTCLANTHPFVREVWGEEWAFAHNGQLHRGFTMQLPAVPVHYQPVGTTDSEMAFCYLLNRLKAEFSKPPKDADLFAFLTKICRELSELGLFNCLISNGDWQLAYAGSLLFYLTRKAPFGEAKLADGDLSVDFSELTSDTDKATLITTIPLTCNEDWQQLYVNECVMFREGDILFKDTPVEPVCLTIEEGIAIARKVGATL